MRVELVSVALNFQLEGIACRVLVFRHGAPELLPRKESKRLPSAEERTKMLDLALQAQDKIFGK